MTVLANELRRSEYSGLSDEAAAAALNALPALVTRRVGVSELMGTLFSAGIWGKLVVAERTASALNNETFEALRSLLDMRSPVIGDVDISGTTFNRWLNLLVQATIISGADRTMLRALANVQPPSRATALGLGTVTAAQVAGARAQIAAEAAAAEMAAAYAPVRERLTRGYGAALAWLNEQEQAGAAVPGWADVLARF